MVISFVGSKLFALAEHISHGSGKSLAEDRDGFVHHTRVLLKPSTRGPSVANYISVRNDCIAQRLTGTLICYIRSLHCIPIETLDITHLEAFACKLAMTDHQPIIIASVYLLLSKTLLSGDWEKLLNLGLAVIVAADHQPTTASSPSNGHLLPITDIQNDYGLEESDREGNSSIHLS
ncbi:hypothetical protein EVAR_100471_1 [Eumeta japonica]|uniref:Uncharacterized protein n=1 Tax=Eumeta variegata TaxID=151549 RepID=A0A4C1SES5_EUMVA|nr:hypothetical protein EVAR_100471_1 [Eumeta japonica]